jgi:hypothetical protein
MPLDPQKLYTISPVAADQNPPKPEFIRMPKQGQHCPYTGLTRSYIYGLVISSKGNNFKPPVRSVCLRERGAKRGVRLIHYDSLLEYLYNKLDGDPES